MRLKRDLHGCVTYILLDSLLQCIVIKSTYRVCPAGMYGEIDRMMLYAGEELNWQPYLHVWKR